MSFAPAERLGLDAGADAIGRRAAGVRAARGEDGLVGPFEGEVEYVEALGRETFLGVDGDSSSVRRRPRGGAGRRHACATASSATGLRFFDSRDRRARAAIALAVRRTSRAPRRTRGRHPRLPRPHVRRARGAARARRGALRRRADALAGRRRDHGGRGRAARARHRAGRAARRRPRRRVRAPRARARRRGGRGLPHQAHAGDGRSCRSARSARWSPSTRASAPAPADVAALDAGGDRRQPRPARPGAQRRRAPT